MPFIGVIKLDPVYTRTDPCRNENHLRLPVAKTTTYGLEPIEYRVCLLWPHYHQKLKIPNPYLNSNGRSRNGMEILASADYVNFMLEIWGFYNYRLVFFRLNIVIRFFIYFFLLALISL